MKKIQLLFCVVCTICSLNASAQVIISSTGRHSGAKGVTFVDFIGYDITNPQNSSSEIIELRKEQKYKGHIALIEFGFNNWTKANYDNLPYMDQHSGEMDLNMAKSIYVGWNLVTYSFPLNKSNTLGLSMAFGLVWRNFVMQNQYVLENMGGIVFPKPIDPSYKKSKYNTFSFKIPVLLEYNVSKNFFVSAGLYADILVSSQTKIKEPTEKHKGNLNSSPLGAGITARAGYKRFYLYGDYGLVYTFKKMSGPVTNPWTVGIGLGF